MPKKKKKWYIHPLFLVMVSLIGSTILGLMTTFLLESRNEKIKEQQIITGIESANKMLEQNMYDDALTKYNSLLEKVSAKSEPLLFAEIKLGEGRTFVMMSYISNEEENLKKAITSFEEANDIYTENKYPEKYALVEGNLANAYLGLSEIRDKEKNLINAINSNLKALEIFTSQKNTEKVAVKLLNLGVCYECLSEVKETEKNLNMAISSYIKSIET
ncbi:MAG: hypothetical protein M1308_12425, partial [Actinobacteria bacterium]|nr:hypothetical protein [Actinomycetota bacterium]